jgi:DNA-binding transcriptional LysR family regulator
MNSGTVLAGTDGFITMTWNSRVIVATGAMSRITLKLSLSCSVALIAAAGPRRRRIELAELVSEPWVLPPPEGVIWSVAMEAFRASGLDYPRATVFTALPEVRFNLLATGRFLTIFSASLLRFPAWRPGLKVLPVELPMARTSIGIVTLKNRTLNPVAQFFIDCAREVAKPLAKIK